MSASEIPAMHPDDRSEMVLGRYRLIKRLGTGAFGSVFSAHDERLDRRVAVKILPRERVNHARFQREARAAARLQHPAIVTLYEAALDDDGAYLVSELVRGRTLNTLLAHGQLSDRDVLEIGAALCGALDHAHSSGVIHRDVKPSNVLVPNRASGPADRAKLTDFGVAHVAGGDLLTLPGDVVGTVAYMSPEQADGQPAGPEADLYSLALVLYEALTGVNPQVARGAGTRTFIPPLRRQRSDIARQLAAGIDTALNPAPARRGTPSQLRAALLHALDGASSVTGIVAPGWGGQEPADTLLGDRPGPEWGEGTGLDVRGLRRRWCPRLVAPVGRGAVSGRPPWPLRGLNALGAGLGATWLCTNLLGIHLAAPAVLVLIVALVALAAPLATSLLTVLMLGTVSLAGAYPALISAIGRRWWQRAAFGAGGFLLLALVGRSVHRNLYWLPAQLPPHHPLALAGAAIWAFAAAVLPLLRTPRLPLLDLIIIAAASVFLVFALDSVGAAPLRGAASGALAGALLLGVPSAVAGVRGTRNS
ncbi:MAG: protein kinase domain-containing protein [Solirubrobacteraceae bacterium]